MAQPAGTTLPKDFVAGNYFDKYRSRNPIHKFLMAGFLRAAENLIKQTNPIQVLEVGCGAGDLAGRLFGPAVEYTGIDLSPAEVDLARERYPGREFLVGSAYGLPFPDRTFDLVVVCEVLEHLDCPDAGLAEAARVCRGHTLVSVPWEPVWRALNMVRGKYWSQWGNTPGHVQHFSRRQIRALVGRHLTPIAEQRPFPWTMILARQSDVGSPE